MRPMNGLMSSMFVRIVETMKTEIMKKVGFSVVPKDGNLEVKKIANHICKSNGGEGVLREICDLIISAKFGTKKKLY